MENMKRNFFLLGLIPSIFTMILTSCASDSSIYTEAYKKQIKSSPVVQTNYGKVQGVTLERSNVDFYGAIPYAKPPVGDLRWKAPQKCESWDGIRECNYFPPMEEQTRWGFLMQLVSKQVLHTKFDRTDFAPRSEDCLYLTIWKPSEDNPNVVNKDKIPVMIYIHGGYLRSGQGWYEPYDGENFARDGVIAVNIEYRVGIYGFFTDPELAEESGNGCCGNYGLMDQAAAIKWVKENIKYFGGDENNITVAGESAGSSSVNAMCCTSLTKGMFNRAIGESSSVASKVPPHTYVTKAKNDEISAQVKKELGVTTLAEMRNVDAKKLRKYTDRFSGMYVDGYVLTEDPYITYSKGNNHEEALLNGFNLNESVLLTILYKTDPEKYLETLKALYGDNAQKIYDIDSPKDKKQALDAFHNVMTASWFAYPHQMWTELSIKNKTPVYLYCFTKENKSYGNSHFGEMIYAWGNVPHNKVYNDVDFKLEETMHSYWLNFIKTGNPNGEGLPQWPQAKDSSGKVFELGEHVGLIENPYAEYFKYFN